MTTELDAELVLDADAILGEGPVWDADAGVLWWVDIEGRQIHRFDPATRADTAIPTPTMVGAVALRARDGLLAALADGVYTVDVESSALTPFRPLDEPPNVRSNESKCDPAGRLLVGTMAYDYAPIGSLYSIDAGGSVRRLLGDLEIANGMAWSADGGTFYYIDSPTRRVDAFDYDLATGSIARRRPWLRRAGIQCPRPSRLRTPTPRSGPQRPIARGPGYGWARHRPRSRGSAHPSRT